MRVDPTYVTNLVAALNSSQAQTEQYSAQLSSGMRVTSLSTDPVAAGRNVLLLNQIQQDDSFTQTSTMVTGQLQVTDSALGQVVSQLTEAISIATRANNGTMNAVDVQSCANQLAGIRAEVIALANSNYQGQFIFAGGQSSTAPFTVSGSTVNYNGDQGTNYLETPGGQRIQLNMPGDQIFDNPSKSVLGALNALIADYSSGTVNTTAAVKDTVALGTALNFVSQQRVTLDNSLTQLTAATTAVNNEKTELIGAQTSLMQADVAGLASQLSLSKSQQTALISVIAGLGSGSLFDKL